MIRRMFIAAVCLASAIAAAPRLTTIQDVLYKADGTRFNGILTISWNSFQSTDSATIVTQSTTVKVVDGNLRVQLVPCPSTTPASYYTVTYNSDGRVQFQEAWSVPSSTQPVRLRDVRTIDSLVGADSGGVGAFGSTVQESDVVGLVADLGARPLKGPALAAGRVAYVDPLGQIDSVSGNPSDCVRVDGSSGPCGTSATSFVDADSPAGIVDGAMFTLSAAPNPATSLSVYRNGMLLKAVQDFTATGNGLHFVTAAAPQPGDTLLASYRVGGSSGGTPQVYPEPQVLCSGTGTTTNSLSLASIGTCSIAAGLLVPGDRVEIHFDLAHSGANSGFTFEVDWAATPLLHRDGAASDLLVTGRAEAAIVAAGAQLSAQSWGTVLPFSAGVATSADAYTSGLTLNFQGKVGLSGDSVVLAGYSVVRVP